VIDPDRSPEPGENQFRADASSDASEFPQALEGLLVLIERGRTEEALDRCRRLLARHPGHVELLFILGGLYQAINRIAAAATCYQKVFDLDPKRFEACYNLGLLLQTQGRLDDAEAWYRRCISLAPDLAAAHNNLGTVLMEAGRLQSAIESFDRAIQTAPDQADACTNKGRCLMKLEAYPEAAASFQAAAAINPASGSAWRNLGLAYQKIDRRHRARDCLKKAMRLDPDNCEIYFDLGNVSLDEGDMDAVIAWYRQGVAHGPPDADRLNNMGRLLLEQGRFGEALNCFREATDCDPENAGAHFNKSLMLLLTGDFAEGWHEYEWRLRKSDWRRGYPWRLDKPRWQGEDFKGRTLLIHCEQGLGDSLQFARYLPLVKARGGRIVFEVPPVLMRLFQRFPGVDRLCKLSADGPPQLPFDIYSPLLSLPGILGTTPDTIPCDVPYLFADQSASARCRRWLCEASCRVGFIWAGSKGHVSDKHRSCRLSQFLPLAQIDGLQLISLQPEQSAEDIRHIDTEGNVIHMGDRIADFADTAALVDCLDLVITVDTAAAHLAGAMGKPVWVLLPFAPDWRWQIDRSDSPWYPTMRLFRQRAPGDWQGVFTHVADALKQFIADKQKTVQQ